MHNRYWTLEVDGRVVHRAHSKSQLLSCRIPSSTAPLTDRRVRFPPQQHLWVGCVCVSLSLSLSLPPNYLCVCVCLLCRWSAGKYRSGKRGGNLVFEEQIVIDYPAPTTTHWTEHVKSVIQLSSHNASALPHYCSQCIGEETRPLQHQVTHPASHSS